MPPRKTPLPGGNRNRCRSGLTLIEVMVALGVLVILVSGIFMVVQTALKTVLMVDNRVSREDEVTNLTDILRSNFRNLPAHAQLTAGPISQAGFGQYLFVVRNAPGFLTWLPVHGSDREVVLLSLRQDSADQRWRVCIKRFEPSLSQAEGELGAQAALKAAAHIPWLELVAGFERIGVRFFDGVSQQWQEAWSQSQRRPALIELTLIYEHTHDPGSAAALFWLPPVKGATL